VGTPPTVMSSAQIMQLAMMGQQNMAPPPIWPTLMQGLMYGPQTPAGLQAAQQMGPAVLGSLISPQTPILGAITQGAMNRANVMGAIGQIAFPGGGGPMGQGFGFQEREAIFQQVKQQQVMPQATMGELSQIIGAGTQMGAFQATRTVSDFKQKFTELLQAVKTVTQTLGTSLQESMALMQQVRGMGLFGQAGANALSQVQGVAYGTGMSPQAVMQGMQQALPGMMQAGIRAPQAMGASLMMQRTMGTAYNLGILNPEDVFQATGMSPEQGGIQAMGSQFLGQMSQRMRHSSRGAWLTAAMLDPTTGGVDQEMMAGLRGGTLSMGELQRQASRRAGQYGQANWVANRGKLASNMMQAEPYAEMLMYRNVLQERGIDDVTSSRGRITLGRLTGMNAEQVAPYAEMIQNIDTIRIEEQANNIRARQASSNFARNMQAGGPQFMRGFQERVQGWVQKLEQKGEQVQKSFEQLMMERMGAAVDAADSWLAAPLQDMMFRPGSSKQIQGIMSRYQAAGAGAGPGLSTFSGPVAPGITDPNQIATLQTQARMLNAGSYIVGATGDVNAAITEAQKQLEKLPWHEQHRLEQQAKAVYTGLSSLTSNWGGQLIGEIPSQVTETFRKAKELEAQAHATGVSSERHDAMLRQANAMRGGAMSQWLRPIAGAVDETTASAERHASFMQRRAEQIATDIRSGTYNVESEGYSAAKGISELWTGTQEFSILGRKVEVTQAEMQGIVQNLQTTMAERGYDLTKVTRNQISGQVYQQAAELAMGKVLKPEEREAIEKGWLKPGELGIGAFSYQELLKGGPLMGQGGDAYDQALRGMFRTEGKGKDVVSWEMSKIRGFLRATSDLSGKMMELTEQKGGALFGKSADDLLSAGKSAVQPGADSRGIFLAALEGKGLSRAQVDEIMEQGPIQEALNRGGDDGVREALNATLMIGRGNAVIGWQDVSKATKTMFGASPEQVDKLKELAKSDPALGNLVGTLSGLAGDTIDPGRVGELVANVYAGSDPKEHQRRLGALSAVGYTDALAAVEGAGNSLRRLQRAGRGSTDARRKALLDVIGRVRDVSGLQGASVEALTTAAQEAGLGGSGVDVRKYLETGKGLDQGALGRQVGDIYGRFASGVRQQESKATQAQQQLPTDIANAIGAITWEIDLTKVTVPGAAAAAVPTGGTGGKTPTTPGSSAETGGAQGTASGGGSGGLGMAVLRRSGGGGGAAASGGAG